MAGNPVYGKGYHDGSTDARQQDILIAGMLVAGAAAVKVCMVGYGKLKEVQAARVEKRMQACDDDPDEDPDVSADSDDPNA